MQALRASCPRAAVNVAIKRFSNVNTRVKTIVKTLERQSENHVPHRPSRKYRSTRTRRPHHRSSPSSLSCSRIHPRVSGVAWFSYSIGAWALCLRSRSSGCSSDEESNVTLDVSSGYHVPVENMGSSLEAVCPTGWRRSEQLCFVPPAAAYD
ncbi:unnamed protein product [Ascophyllum nodosum]